MFETARFADTAERRATVRRGERIRLHRDRLQMVLSWNYARCRRSLKVWLSANQRTHSSLHLCHRAHRRRSPCWDFRYGQSRVRSRCVQTRKEEWLRCGCLTQLYYRHYERSCQNARSMAALRRDDCQLS